MPAGRRAYWKGYLRLSLVSIGIELFDAEDKKSEISFNQIHKPSGRRVNHVKSVQGIGPVPNSEIVSGYEIEKDNYVILEPDELDAVKLESKRTIELNRFVPLQEIDARYIEQPYYVVAADEYANEGYLVIREALMQAKRAGLGQLTHGGKEHLVAISALEKGLVLFRLRYANEVKPAADYFSDLPRLKLDREMVELATELVQKKSGAFEPEKYSDTYATALRSLINRKAKGEKIIATPEAEPVGNNVINLMDALRKSLKGNAASKEAPVDPKPARKTRPRAAPKAARRRSG